MPKRSLAAEPCRRATAPPNRSLTYRRFKLFAALAIGGLVLVQTANAQTRLLRTPTVSTSQIAFAYANNIWTVPRSGGSARRLTSFQGQTSNPHFSPDGKWIAFSGEYAGNLDVYVVPEEGGEPGRPMASQFCSHRLAPPGRRPERHASGPCPLPAALKNRFRCHALTRAKFQRMARA